MVGSYRALKAFVMASETLAPLDSDKPSLLAAPRERGPGLPVLTESVLLAPLSDASVAAQNRQGIGMWAVQLPKAGITSEVERDAILAAIQETAPGEKPMLREAIPGWAQAVALDDLNSTKHTVGADNACPLMIEITMG